MVKKFMSQKGYLAEPIIREDEEEDEKVGRDGRCR
jgi:hypothetical protein